MSEKSIPQTKVIIIGAGCVTTFEFYLSNTDTPADPVV
jgi:hypothetical protein